MHKAKLGAPIVFAAEKMQSQSAARRKVDLRSAWRHLGVGEQCSAAKLEIGNDFARLCKIPFKRERIEAETVRRLAALDHYKGGHNVHRVFELTLQEAGADGVCQNPAVASPEIPDLAVRGASIQPVAAAGPHL